MSHGADGAGGGDRAGCMQQGHGTWEPVERTGGVEPGEEGPSTGKRWVCVQGNEAGFVEVGVAHGCRGRNRSRGWLLHMQKQIWV